VLSLKWIRTLLFIVNLFTNFASNS